jgi:hypothetical protein
MKFLHMPLMAITIALVVSMRTYAAEGTSYQYDVHGRLIAVSISGIASSNANVELKYDKSNNRTQYKVTGSTRNSPPFSGKMVVVPLNGYSLIPVPSNKIGE